MDQSNNANSSENLNSTPNTTSTNTNLTETNAIDTSEDLFVKPSVQAKLAAAVASASNNSQPTATLNPAILEEVEEETPERTLSEFLVMMDQYTPIIPDAVTDFYLSKTGFECEDYRIKRLLALATQKFIGDIATDAFQYSKIRQQMDKNKKMSKNKKTVLTMQDLSLSLREYGVNVKKPDYYL